jgi:N6-L-threonylcarbamoyladenine synthase
MLVLGIETSCDETAVALVRDGREVLADRVASQTDLHAAYGGVVPEVACRAHLERLFPLMEEVLKIGSVPLTKVEGVAVTNRPGLIGALLVGVGAAKALAWALDKPLIGVDHLRAHLYANVMEHGDIDYPAVSLLVSGGHTLLYRCGDDLDADLLGRTIDDAAGEAFDKVAKILGLGYPGGPAIDRSSEGGDPGAVRFPRSLGPGLDFSFSGLKTAVLYHCCGQDPSKMGEAPVLADRRRADLAASFQEAVVDVLVSRVRQAARRAGARSVAVCGGVACNRRLRGRMELLCREEGYRFYVPRPAYCTDNAVMIAGLGGRLLAEGERSAWDLDAYARADYKRAGSNDRLRNEAS